jgi:hypothetical protein
MLKDEIEKKNNHKKIKNKRIRIKFERKKNKGG